MTAPELRAALKALGISQRWLARQLGVHVNTVNDWATGRDPIAPYVDFVFKLLHERRMLEARLATHQQLASAVRAITSEER